MTIAGYDKSLQDHYFSLYHKYILPALGPRPDGITGEPFWRSPMTDSCGLIEPSLNRHGGSTVVRFGVSPVSRDSFTAVDPLNQHPVAKLVRQLAEDDSSVDLTWFSHFERELFISREEASSLHGLIPSGKLAIQGTLAFDLVDRAFVPKAVFFPHAKAMLRGMSSVDCLWESILKLDMPCLSLRPALDTLRSYLTTCPRLPDGTPSVLLATMGFDCVLPESSRIKIYLCTSMITLEKVREVYTLNGRLKNEKTMRSLKVIEALWESLVTDPDSRNISPNAMNTSVMLFNFEITPGHPLPNPKIYIPAMHFSNNDQQIMDTVVNLYQEQGWAGLAASYRENLPRIL